MPKKVDWHNKGEIILFYKNFNRLNNLIVLISVGIIRILKGCDVQGNLAKFWGLLDKAGILGIMGALQVAGVLSVCVVFAAKWYSGKKGSKKG